MNTVRWSDALSLEFAPFDTANERFAGLLAQAQRADDGSLPQAWDGVLEHLAQQFEREDRWMRETGFASASPHTLQHKVVLNVLREGVALLRRGQLTPVRQMADELATWFAKHTQAHDAALALHLRREWPADALPPH